IAVGHVGELVLVRALHQAVGGDHAEAVRHPDVPRHELRIDLRGQHEASAAGRDEDPVAGANAERARIVRRESERTVRALALPARGAGARARYGTWRSGARSGTSPRATATADGARARDRPTPASRTRRPARPPARSRGTPSRPRA